MATKLDQQAKDTLRGYGVSQAAWLRAYPACDTCGCPDDRCIGFHHEAGGPCDLQYWLDEPSTHPDEVREQLQRAAARMWA